MAVLRQEWQRQQGSAAMVASKLVRVAAVRSPAQMGGRGEEEGRTCTSLGRRHVKRMERGHGAQRAIVAGGEKEEGSGAGGATCRGG
jgi:hypothetical protein